jgi:hypothetical protein
LNKDVNQNPSPSRNNVPFYYSKNFKSSLSLNDRQDANIRSFDQNDDTTGPDDSILKISPAKIFLKPIDQQNVSYLDQIAHTERPERYTSSVLDPSKTISAFRSKNYSQNLASSAQYGN